MVRMGLAEPTISGSIRILKPALTARGRFNLLFSPESSIFLSPSRVTFVSRLYGVCMVHKYKSPESFDPGEFY